MGATFGDVPHVPGYDLDRILGEGGMGRVYHAVRASDGREVAVKVILPSVADDGASQFLARFHREIQVCKRFAHPNVVTLLDGGTLPGSGAPFLVMEYLEGTTLRDARGFGRLPEATCVDVLRQLCLAFDYYHPMGFVHRDLKPSNVFVTKDGRVVLLDFGLVYASDRTRLTGTSEVAGTLATMAPEQIRTERLGPYTDVYQLGVTLYLGLVDDLPYQPATIASFVLDAPEVPRVRPPHEARPDVSPELSALVLRCLEVSPARRFQSADELRAALDELPPPGTRSGRHDAVLTGASRAVDAPSGAGREPRRWLAAGALVLLLLAVALGALLARRPHRTPSSLAPRISLAGDVDPLVEGLLRAAGPPSEEECRVLGEALLQGGLTGRVGLPPEAPAAALGLWLVARRAAAGDEPALAARAAELYELALRRHGPEPAPGWSVLDAALAAAARAGTSARLAGSLRPLLDGAPAGAGRGRLALALARALLADYQARSPADSWLRRELQGYMEIVVRRDPGLEEASRLLLPLVLSRGAEPPLTATADVLLEVLHARRSELAVKDCLDVLPALLQAQRDGVPGTTRLLLKAASVAELRVGDHDPALGTTLSERSLALVRGAAQACWSPGDRAVLDFHVARLLVRANRVPDACAAFDRMRPEELPPGERWRYYLLGADLERRRGRADRVGPMYERGAAVAPSPELVTYFKRRRFETGFEDALFQVPGKAEAATGPKDILE